MKKIIIALFLIILAALLLIPFIKRGPELEYITPQGRMIRLTHSLEGEVVPEKEITYYSSVSGKVIQAPDSGGRYKEGELLYQIDDKPLRFRLNSFQLQIESVLNEIKFLEEEVLKLRNLVEAGAIPRSELRQAEQKLNGVIKHKEILTEERNSINHGLSHYRQNAPYDGAVISVMVRPDEAVVPGKPILTFGNIDKKEIKCLIRSAELGIVKESLPVEITSPLLTTVIPGLIDRISYHKKESPAVPGFDSENEDMYRVYITYDNNLLNFNIGYKVYVEIIREEKFCLLTLPHQCIIISEDNKSFVLVSGSGGLALQEVFTGLSADEYIEITGGISENDKVLLNPYKVDFNLKAGRVVKKKYSLKKHVD
ncbi:MAG TPA: HlyD family efflux transporter periplasmic adaptor subunit [Firmicutes bacterium]|nr:HlyD family efflux transporter periplasmic adaptor subunit [Bacillota bacterium]